MSSNLSNEEIKRLTLDFASSLFTRRLSQGPRHFAAPIDLPQVVQEHGLAWPASATDSYEAQLWSWNGQGLFQTAVTEVIRVRYKGFAAPPPMVSKLVADALSDTPATAFFTASYRQKTPQFPFDLHETFFVAIHHLALRHSMPAVQAWVKANISDIVFELLAYVLPLIEHIHPAPGVPYAFLQMSEYWDSIKNIEDGEIVDRPGRGRRSVQRQIAPLPRRWDRS